MGRRKKRRKREPREIIRRNPATGAREFRCAKCGKWKPAAGFWRCAKTRSGRASWCKTCTSETYELRRKRRRKVSPIGKAEKLREEKWRRRLRERRMRATSLELRRVIETTLRPKLDIVRLCGRPYTPQRECFG